MPLFLYIIRAMARRLARYEGKQTERPGNLNYFLQLRARCGRAVTAELRAAARACLFDCSLRSRIWRVDRANSLQIRTFPSCTALFSA